MWGDRDVIVLRRRDEGPANAIMLFVVLAIGILMASLLFGPGMLALALINAVMGERLDPGQMWAFSVVWSGLCYAALWKALGDARRAGRVYFIISGIVIGGLVLCRFGLHAEFPGSMVGYFFGR